MQTFEVELKRTVYVIINVEAENKDEAEELAWKELASGAYNPDDGSWEVESIEAHKP